MAAAPDPPSERLPIAVITGFLGSGKTTLIRRLLAHPGMNRAAVIVNEFGEVGIDHELIASSSESVSVLANGCLCCVVRTDLQETLRKLFIRRQAAEVMAFDRVFIETSGLADPVPVTQALLTDGVLAEQYRVDCIATLVDAVNGAAQIDQFEEALKQVAIADRMIVTKRDLVDDAREAALRACLAAINPHAELAVATHGELDPGFLTGVSPRGTRLDAPALGRWLRAEPPPLTGEERYLGALVSANRHRNIVSFVLWFDEPFSWGAFANAMQLLANLRGPDLLRVKGLVNVATERGPVVVHGAQHVFHPPLTLDSWPGPDRRSRLVFITRGIPRGTIAQLFDSVARLAGPAQNVH
ncbi:MAG: CobW family GTP-binding protein [Burkholderiales bacterium]